MLNTEIIKAEALRLGFDLIGITDPNPVAGYSRFAEWLAGGYHASMQYLDTPRSHALRAAPEQVLPGCQTILCVAKQYPKPPVLKSTVSDQARIAAYAWQSDYHLELPPLMENLVAFIQKFSSIQFDYKIYTDSGPVLEKELAQRAGLGWIGKNSCLINPQKGSMFLLGEIFLTIKRANGNIHLMRAIKTRYTNICTYFVREPGKSTWISITKPEFIGRAAGECASWIFRLCHSSNMNMTR